MNVARISGLPLGPSENVLSFTRPDQPPPPPGQAPNALYRVVDPEYFATMKIPLLAGRVFLPPDREGAQRVVVISRRMADVFCRAKIRWVARFKSAANRQVSWLASSRTCAHKRSPPPLNPMHVPHAQSGQRSMMYVIKSSLGTAQVLGASREVVKQLDARLPLIGPSSMQDVVEEQLAGRASTWC